MNRLHPSGPLIEQPVRNNDCELLRQVVDEQVAPLRTADRTACKEKMIVKNLTILTNYTLSIANGFIKFIQHVIPRHLF
jgi:hypothetical protein